MIIYTYNIYRPTGNDTALVLGIVNNPQLRQRINDKIMRQNPNVEQVGFIKTTPPYQLMMAGGEFCGNATRSATFLILKGKSGQIKLKVSGTKQILIAGVDKKGNAWTQIPIPQDIKIFNPMPTISIVNLEGITQVVTPLPPNLSNIKEIGFKLLKQLNLLTTTPAAGATFYQSTPSGIKILPVVWVRDIQTLFCETACGSATAAIGIIKSLNTDKSVVNLPVIQPTGQIINVNVSLSIKRTIKNVTISGPIQSLATGKKILLERK